MTVAEAQGIPGMHRHTLQNQPAVVYIYYYIVYTLYLFKKNIPEHHPAIT